MYILYTWDFAGPLYEWIQTGGGGGGWVPFDNGPTLHPMSIIKYIYLFAYSVSCPCEMFTILPFSKIPNPHAPYVDPCTLIRIVLCMYM